MRLKHVKGAEERIALDPLVITREEELAEGWDAVFPDKQPIYLELGMGKGQFLMENALRNPNINYVGVERYATIMLRALEKRAGEPYCGLKNIQFLCMNAQVMAAIFPEGSVSKIYLNFSDPWPKERHHKRRLTSREYLKIYDKILKKDGMLEFKTDNRALFDFSLEEIEEAGWKVLAMTRDLHQDPVMNAGNIMTEYEEKFSEEGNPICKLIAGR